MSEIAEIGRTHGSTSRQGGLAGCGLRQSLHDFERFFDVFIHIQ